MNTMNHEQLMRLAIAIPIAGVGLIVAHELILHLFALSCGVTGLASWSWMIRPFIQAVGLA